MIKLLFLLNITVMALSLSLFCGCYEYQAFKSAKMLTKNELEIQPNISVIPVASDFVQFGTTFVSLGVQGGYGLSNHFSLYSCIKGSTLVQDFNIGTIRSNVNVLLQVEPKWAIIRNYLAFGLPLGYYSRYSLLQMAPVLYYTSPITEKMDVNVALKGDLNVYMGYPGNAGMFVPGVVFLPGFSCLFKYAKVYFEAGIGYYFSDVVYYSVGCGVSIPIIKDKSRIVCSKQ